MSKYPLYQEKQLDRADVVHTKYAGGYRVHGQRAQPDPLSGHCCDEVPQTRDSQDINNAERGRQGASAAPHPQADCSNGLSWY